MTSLKQKIAYVHAVRDEVMDNIQAIHGERAAEVAESLSYIMLLQKSVVQLTVESMNRDKRPQKEIEAFVNEIQNPMTIALAKISYLFTDSMEDNKRHDLVRSVVSLSTMIANKANE